MTFPQLLGLMAFIVAMGWNIADVVDIQELDRRVSDLEQSR